MKLFYKLLLIVSVLLSQKTFALDSNGKSVSLHNSDHSEVTCPSTNFSKFIRIFSNDENVQRIFTTYPLKKQQLDLDADTEPKKVIRELRRHEISFPILPLNEERNRQSLEIRIDSVMNRKAKITLIKPDTDYQVSYFFRMDGCWNLERIEDTSL